MSPVRLWVYLRLIWDARLLSLLSLHTTSTRSLPSDDTVLEGCASSRTAADFVVCLSPTIPVAARLTQQHIFETIEGFTCKGQCGTQTLACSCRPMCVSAGSCCDDFLEECPKEVQRLNDDLRWLRHVKMFCTRHNVYIVNACPDPGSTLDKLLRAASNPSAQPSTQPHDTFSASDYTTFETTTDREMAVVQTDESGRFESLNMFNKGNNGVSVVCNNTSISSVGSSTGSGTGSGMGSGTASSMASSTASSTVSGTASSMSKGTASGTASSMLSGTARGTASNATIKSGTHFKSLTTVYTKEKEPGDRGRFSKGKESNVGRTPDFQGGDPLLGNRGAKLRTPDHAGEILSERDEFHNEISVDFKQTYANAPVTDVNTGLVFANSSIFDCYSSVTGERIYWEFDLEPIGKELVNLTMSDMLKRFVSEVRLARPTYTAPIDAKPLHERCIYKVRDKCPEKSVFGPGCARSTGYVKCNENIYYRNPFCSACNKKNMSLIFYVDPSIWRDVKGNSEFRITMIPEWNRVRFVASFNPRREYSLAPLWKEMTCEETDPPRMRSIGNDVIYPNGSQSCRILSCRAGVLKYGKCYVETVFGIKLPHIPGQSKTGDFKDIPNCLMKFNKEIVEASVSVIPIAKTPDGPTNQLKIYLFGFREFTLDRNLREIILNIIWAKVEHLGMSPADFCVLSLGKHVTVNTQHCLVDRKFRFTDRCSAGCWETTRVIHVIAMALGFQFL